MEALRPHLGRPPAPPHRGRRRVGLRHVVRAIPRAAAGVLPLDRARRRGRPRRAAEHDAQGAGGAAARGARRRAAAVAVSHRPQRIGDDPARAATQRAVSDEVAPAVAAVDRTLAQRERLAELVGDLQQLSERQRGALVMRELSGMSYDEIGGVLDVSPAAARQSVFEARHGAGRDRRGARRGVRRDPPSDLRRRPSGDARATRARASAVLRRVPRVRRGRALAPARPVDAAAGTAGRRPCWPRCRVGWGSARAVARRR